eukprot:SAG31_NODE_2722_length_5188_cov_6.223030_3_plen_252_part_00
MPHSHTALRAQKQTGGHGHPGRCSVLLVGTADSQWYPLHVGESFNGLALAARGRGIRARGGDSGRDSRRRGAKSPLIAHLLERGIWPLSPSWLERVRVRAHSDTADGHALGAGRASARPNLAVEGAVGERRFAGGRNVTRASDTRGAGRRSGAGRSGALRQAALVRSVRKVHRVVARRRAASARFAWVCPVTGATGRRRRAGRAGRGWRAGRRRWAGWAGRAATTGVAADARLALGAGGAIGGAVGAAQRA